MVGVIVVASINSEVTIISEAEVVVMLGVVPVVVPVLPTFEALATWSRGLIVPSPETS